MKLFPGGSVWRKWDLHVHAPGTKLSDGYGSPSDWDEFCRILEESDVAAFGIADYFSADAFYVFKEEHQRRYPSSNKVFMPNIELRLNETVNRNNEIVDVHILFRPDVEKQNIDRFLGELNTQITDGHDRNLRCSDLTTRKHFEEATITRSDLEKAVRETFGKKAIRSEHLLVLVPANNNGIRAQNGVARKANIADQIDKLADAMFGGSAAIDHFLSTDRFEDKDQRSTPKPVFSGCDAHSFMDLKDWLGKHVTDSGKSKEITWIKADPTFEGLQQTLVEPEHRVKIQPTKPDAKQPYQYIAKVQFSGTDDFPEEIRLNQNLVSIIGTRSSGKSALLAYIAHSIDPEYAVNQQLAATLMTDHRKAGPAAGMSWEAVKDIKCTIEWGDSGVETGKVIYIPQNSLYAISERPDDITAKIQPSLYRLDPSFEAAHRRAQADLHACNTSIRDTVNQWFSLTAELGTARTSLRNLGDKKGVTGTRDSLAGQIRDLRNSSSLTEREISAYESLVSELGTYDSRVKVIQGDSRQLSPYLTRNGTGTCSVRENVSIDIQMSPSISQFPPQLREKAATLIQEGQDALIERIKQEILAYQRALDEEIKRHEESSNRLRQQNQPLIEKNKANSELDLLLQNHKKQEDLLIEIATREGHIVKLEEDRSSLITSSPVS